MKSFIFGGNTGLSYEQLKRQQAQGELMRAQGSRRAPRNVGEGIHSAANSIMGALLAGKAASRIADKEKADSDALMASVKGRIDPARMAILDGMPLEQRRAYILQMMDRQDAAKARGGGSGGASALQAALAGKLLQDMEAPAQGNTVAGGLSLGEPVPETPAEAPQAPSMPFPAGEASTAPAADGLSFGELVPEPVDQRTELQNKRLELARLAALSPDKNIRAAATRAATVIDMQMDMLPEVEPQYTQVTGADIGMTGELADAMFNVSPNGQVTRIGGAGVNVNVGDQGPKMGPVAPNTVVIADPSTASGYRSVPIDDSPADTTEAEANASTAATQNQLDSANVVVQQTERMKKALNRGFWDGNFLPETGVIGSKLTGINQEAADMQGQIETLKGMVTFDRILKLKEASENGASGLGQVTAPELTMLASQLGALDQNVSAELLISTLNNIESVFTRLPPEAVSYLTGAIETLPTSPQASSGGSELSADERAYLGLD